MLLFGFLVVAATLTVAPPGVASPSTSVRPGRSPAPQEAADPGGARLHAATVEVIVEAPNRARVEADFEVEGGEIELLLTRFSGQRIDRWSATLDGAPLRLRPPRPPERSTVLRVPIPTSGDRERLQLTYQVRVPESFRYRFPLPVPDAAPPADRRSVRLAVRLPPDAHYQGGGFPQLAAAVATPPLLTADLVALPGFVHVPYGAQPPGWIDLNLQLELLAVGVLLLPLLWQGARRLLRRRRRR